MAATYGYGGEFSSDEDIDKLEQQSERINQSNSFAQLKPNRQQIDEAIQAIKQMPIDKDVNIPDDLLAALLDHYKTQRGPIVDSTRGLYKKIILRLIRGEQPVAASNGDSAKDNNGVANNNNNNNNNSDRKQRTEVASSDEDEPMPPASDLLKVKRFDSRVVYNSGDSADGQVEPMEVDSEGTPAVKQTLAGRRAQKGETEESSSDADTEESDSESESPESSDSEVLDVTPVKSAPQTTQQPQRAKPASGSQSSVVAKKVTIAASSKDKPEQKKKPYTRSQRIATRSATSAGSVRNITQLDVSSSKNDVVASSDRNSVFNTSSRSRTRLGVNLVIAAFVVLTIAFAVYHYRTELTRTAESFMSKSGVKF